MSLPKIGTARTETLGVSTVASIVWRPQTDGGLGFAYRSQLEVDVGIDGHIEIVDQATYECTGKLVGVQVKAGPSFFEHPTSDGWAVYIHKSTVNYWRGYSLPVLLTIVDTDQNAAYWVLVSEGAFKETEQNYRIIIPRFQRLDSGAADTISQLALQAPAALAAKLQALTEELSAATAAELELHRSAWREGRRVGARAWLGSLVCSPARLAAIDPVVAAQVLRYTAAVTLDEGGDVQEVRALIDDARRRDPKGDDFRLRSALLARERGVDAALAMLADSQETSAQLMRASILFMVGRRDDAAQVLDSTRPTAQTDLVDWWRLNALLRLAEKDMAGALNATAQAEVHGPSFSQVRLLRASLTYLKGLVPDGVPEDLPPWPQPIREEFLRRDPAAIGCSKDAAEKFQRLLSLDWTPTERRHLETWLLAALVAVPTNQTAAVAFAQEVLDRDPSQPFVLLWAATENLAFDLAPHVRALEEEVGRTQEIRLAMIFVAVCLALGQEEAVGGWLDSWRQRFTEAGAYTEWAVWRARQYLAIGDTEGARALLGDADPEGARTLEAGILAADAAHTGDSSALAAHLEAVGKETGDPLFVLEACREHARAGRWEAVVPHLDLLLNRLPTPPVRRLAIFTRFHTSNFSGCTSLLDEALEHPGNATDLLEFRRLRADVRLRTGDIPGAIEDMETVITHSPQPPLTRDLLNVARARFLAGHTHELAACARRLGRHDDLQSADSLMLCEVLVHDDPALACTFWHRANTQGIDDPQVATAVSLGYHLGLDLHMGALHARMAALAETGIQNIQQVKIEELISIQRGWYEQRAHVLELYRRGDTATHLVAEFLNEPLVHLYHTLPAANEEQVQLRHRFALQLRDGSRGLPHNPGEIVAPGRMALDLSALLLAAHVGILPELEEQLGPVRLPHLVIVALREQRDKLTPHQPSRVQVTKTLLAAERRGRLRKWDGNLPVLELEERAAAGNWWQWVALMERAHREKALVLDLPLTTESPYGRPAAVAGECRLKDL